MIYLLLAILFSSLVTIMMRVGENKVQNDMAMFMSNYITCAILSLLFFEKGSFNVLPGNLKSPIIFGVITGILYLVCFVFLKKNISKNGVVLSTTFMKLGIIIPTLVAIVFFKEQPKITQIIGLVLVLLSIIVIHKEKESKLKINYLLITLLITGGIADSMTNTYDKLGALEYKNYFLLFTFVAAFICSLIIWIKKKQKICIWDIIFGILVGLPNYLSTRFILLSMHEMPAIIVYPVLSVLTIILVLIVGIIIFKEKINKYKLSGLLLALVALIMLNI